MRKLENKELDEIGKVLVKAGTLPAREIDEIVGNPDLFDSIRKRIETGPGKPSTRRSRFLVPGVASFASLALVAFAGVAYFKSGTVVKQVAQSSPQVVSTTQVSKPGNVTADTINDPPKRIEFEPEDDAEPVDIRPTRASHRTPSRQSRPRQPVVEPVRISDNFYAVSYAGDPHETERGGRIVRVEIPRSTLFSMGINVPLENESATVKADLLVGSDGVTRAIRVVE